MPALPTRLHVLAVAATCALLLGCATVAQAQRLPSDVGGLCGPLENAFGPFDYRTVDSKTRLLVERVHFTPKVEALRGGQTGYIAGDLDYTLRAMPNHPRALMAMARLAERDRTPHPAGATYPAECYFDRAVRFKPDDPMPRVLYGIYLAKAKRREEAQLQLEAAATTGSGDAQIAYNLGIGYLELGDFAKARDYAKKAAAMGIPFPGLRERLKRAGQWVE